VDQPSPSAGSTCRARRHPACFSCQKLFGSVSWVTFDDSLDRFNGKRRWLGVRALCTEKKETPAQAESNGSIIPVPFGPLLLTVNRLDWSTYVRASVIGTTFFVCWVGVSVAQLLRAGTVCYSVVAPFTFTD
jgi:hypothetical protein